jgi:hypothetical protein
MGGKQVATAGDTGIAPALGIFSRKQNARMLFHLLRAQRMIFFCGPVFLVKFF